MDDLIRRSDVLGLLEDMLLFGEYEIIACSFSKADEEKAYQAFKDIPAANPWIPCSERMMPDGEMVLVRLTNGEFFVMSRSGDVISDGLRHLTDLSTVERWMPIPDA